MTSETFNGNRMHPSVYRQAGIMSRWAIATPRPHGALRYRCPTTGSFVLVTDEPSLRKLASPPARLRCADCREIHLIAVPAESAPAIVAAADKP